MLKRPRPSILLCIAWAPQGLVSVLRELQRSQEEGAAAAIARVMGLEFGQFQDQWRQFLAAKKLQEYDGVRLPRFELKEEGKLRRTMCSKRTAIHRCAHACAISAIACASVAMTRPQAVEYGRALDKDPHSPYLLNKLAATLMAQGALARGVAIAATGPAAGSRLRDHPYQSWTSACGDAGV